MTISTSEEEEEPVSDKGDEVKERGLDLEILQDLFNMARGLQQRTQEINDNVVRAVEFSNRIDDVMTVYKSILVQKIKQRSQLPITMLLVRRKPPPVTTPPPAASLRHPRSSKALREPVQSFIIFISLHCTGLFIFILKSSLQKLIERGELRTVPTVFCYIYCKTRIKFK